MADAAEADPDEARKQELKIRKDAAEMEVLIRFYEVFSKTMEGLRKALGDIAGRIDAIDATVFHGMGVVEETVLTQGMNEGATKFGIYGILDLLFNTNSQVRVQVLVFPNFELRIKHTRRIVNFLNTLVQTTGVLWN